MKVLKEMIAGLEEGAAIPAEPAASPAAAEPPRARTREAPRAPATRRRRRAA